jgi:hypothetical protein
MAALFCIRPFLLSRYLSLSLSLSLSLASICELYYLLSYQMSHSHRANPNSPEHFSGFRFFFCCLPVNLVKLSVTFFFFFKRNYHSSARSLVVEFLLYMNKYVGGLGV